MSITHILKIQSNRSPEAVLKQLLTSNIGLQPGRYDQMKADGDGLYGRVFSIDVDGQKYLLDTFGVRANLRISFDEDFDGDRDQALGVIGQTINLLFEQEAGDAMFFWVVDTPILKRTSGAIKVIDEPGFEWLRTALKNAGLSYETQSEQNIRQLEG